MLHTNTRIEYIHLNNTHPMSLVTRPVLACCMLCATSLQAQLTIEENLTPSELVQVLLGGGVAVTNISYNGLPDPSGPQSGTGLFNSVEGIAGAFSGMTLGSGYASSLAGHEAGINSDHLNTGSDPDLLSITAEYDPSFPSVNDVAVLEFDVVPAHDSLCLDFVFASEEYPGFNCSPQFNDVFGFFLSGPGISGPYMNNAANVALIPGTDLPVSIANVHGPEGFGCPAANEQYYVYNEGSDVFAMGGHTTLLPIAVAVQPGQTYHMKIAIGDAGDSGYDSVVLLEAGGFKSVPSTSMGIAPLAATPFRLVRAEGHVEILFNGVPAANGQVLLLDAAGRVVEQVNVAGTSIVLSTAGLASGTYLVKLLNDPASPLRFVVD